MADHRKAHARILGWEGDWSFDPDDLGNYYPDKRKENLIGTYKGISAACLGARLGRRPIPADFYALASRGADVFRTDYWERLGAGVADKIASQAVAESLIDWKWVGQPGPVTVASFLSSLGLTTGGKPDAVKINAYPTQRLLDMIASARWSSYKNHAPTFWKHGDGWEYRIAGFTRPDLIRATVPQDLVDHWRNIWYKGRPPVRPAPAPSTGETQSTFLWLAIPAAIAYVYGPRLWRMARRLIK